MRPSQPSSARYFSSTSNCSGRALSSTRSASSSSFELCRTTTDRLRPRGEAVTERFEGDAGEPGGLVERGEGLVSEAAMLSAEPADSFPSCLPADPARRGEAAVDAAVIGRDDLRVATSGLALPSSSDATKLVSDPARALADPELAAPRRRFAGLSSRSTDADTSPALRRRSGDFDFFFLAASHTSSAAVCARLRRGSHYDNQPVQRKRGRAVMSS